MTPAEKTFQKLVAGMVLHPFFAEEDEQSGQLGFHRAKRIEPGHEA